MVSMPKPNNPEKVHWISASNVSQIDFLIYKRDFMLSLSGSEAGAIETFEDSTSSYLDEMKFSILINLELNT